MTEFVYYLIKVMICSGVLFLYYYVFLRNKIFHQWNRFYLLGTVALSLLLPLIEINLSGEQAPSENTLKLFLVFQHADNYLEEFTVSDKSNFTGTHWLYAGYGLICFSLLLSLLYSIHRILSIIRSNPVRLLQQVKFIITNVKGTPFSFFNYVFWNESISLNTETGRQIFQHELVHVEEKHTLDKLFLQFVLIVFWCNPFFWLIRKELKYIHEFIADQRAVGEGGSEAFANMVLQTVYPQQFQSITNSFFQTSIKRRILMLNQVRNPRTAYVSRIIALPLIAMLAFTFTVRAKQEQSKTEIKKVPSAVSSEGLTHKGKKISSVDVNKLKDQITISYADGTSEQMSIKDADAKGLIHNSGFLNKNNKPANGDQPQISINGVNEQPLFILDGKEVKKDEMEKIDPKSIKSVNVLKGKTATDKYGNKGVNGVVEIFLKEKISDDKIIVQENDKTIGSGTIEVDSKTSEIKGHVVMSSPIEEGPVFEKAEFSASVDQDEWKKFLEQHTQPIIEEAGKSAKAGKYTVLVRFVVEKDGSLSDIKIVQDPGYQFGEKVLNMMRYAPKWKPAIQNERVVRSYHTQPITFIISNG